MAYPETRVKLATVAPESRAGRGDASLPCRRPPAAPVVVAITGHRDLAPQSLGAVADAVRKALSRLQSLFPSVQLASALAEGGDQLAAGIAADLGIPLIAVLPLPYAPYRQSLEPESRDLFDELWARAALRLELPWIGAERDLAPQYEQLGLLFARSSNILLALWDGAHPWETLGPQARETTRGGTAHVIYLRQDGRGAPGGPSINSVISQESSWLDLARGGPIIHIATPRLGDVKPPEGTAGGMRLWVDDFDLGEGLQESREAREAAPRWIRPPELLERHFPSLRKIAELNRELTKLDHELLSRQVGYLRPRQAEDPPQPGAQGPLGWLRGLQAGVDLAAQAAQRKLVGRGLASPGGRRRGIQRPGAHLLFAGAVPVCVLLLETYAELWRNVALLLAYLAILAAAFVFDIWEVRRGEWQARFQDYRALAEALRVQLFLALSAATAGVADSYLRKQRDELGWLREALRGPHWWALALALALPAPQRELVQECWLLDQKQFFIGAEGRAGRAALNARAHRVCRIWTSVFVALGILCGAALLGIAMLGGLRPGAQAAHLAADVLLAAMGLAPAVGAFFSIYSERLAFEQQAHAYLRTGRLFERAIRQAAAIAPDQTEAFRSLVLELGQEALDESSDWLSEHRKRPIGFVATG